MTYTAISTRHCCTALLGQYGGNQHDQKAEPQTPTKTSSHGKEALLSRRIDESLKIQQRKAQEKKENTRFHSIRWPTFYSRMIMLLIMLHNSTWQSAGTKSLLWIVGTREKLDIELSIFNIYIIGVHFTTWKGPLHDLGQLRSFWPQRKSTRDMVHTMQKTTKCLYGKTSRGHEGLM